ncbi:DUF6538 domain-containing protein, partial [Xanthomonas graminis]
MRIPHHLVRAPSGLWSYRQRVPVNVQPIVGRQTFKRTLHTYDMREARLRALTLASRYAQAFAVLRERRMQSQDDDLDALLARLTGTERPQELTLNRTRSADGSITEQWQIDTPEDVTLFQQLMALTAPQPSALGELIQQHVPPLPTPRRVTQTLPRINHAREGPRRLAEQPQGQHPAQDLDHQADRHRPTDPLPRGENQAAYHHPLGPGPVVLSTPR